MLTNARDKEVLNMQFTLMPDGATSFASAFVIASKPPLEAE